MKLTKTKVECKACGGHGFHWVIDPESLKAARIAAGISLRRFAEQLHFTPPYLSDIENGRRNCTAEIEHAYANLNPTQNTHP